MRAVEADRAERSAALAAAAVPQRRSHPALAAGASPFAWSLGRRLGWAGGAALLLWLAVLWALA
jgi:hypothetical protein